MKFCECCFFNYNILKNLRILCPEFLTCAEVPKVHIRSFWNYQRQNKI